MPSNRKPTCLLKPFVKAILIAFGISLVGLKVQAQTVRKSNPSGSTGQTGSSQSATTNPKPGSTPGKATLEVAPKQARPVGQPLRIPKLSPELEDILIEWEQKSSKVQRLEGTFEHTSYDNVWKAEFLSSGIYCFEFPDKGAFKQTGIKSATGKGRRADPKTKELFSAKAGPDERWVCDGAKIVKINEADKQYEEVTIPPEDRGQNIRNSPLPFLFGLKANEAKQRYAFELNEEKTSEKQIWLKVEPLMQQDLVNYKRAEVILDRSTCLPIAVKLYDAKGNKEDVYYFPRDKMTINKRSWVQWLAGDPLKPDLRSYKRTISPDDSAAGPAGTKLALPPDSRKSAAVQPTGGRATLNPKPPKRTAQLPEDEETPIRPTQRAKVRP